MPGRLKPTPIWIGLFGALLGSAGSALIDAVRAGNAVHAWVAVGLSILALALWTCACVAYDKAFETWVRRGKP